MIQSQIFLISGYFSSCPSLFEDPIPILEQILPPKSPKSSSFMYISTESASLCTFFLHLPEKISFLPIVLTFPLASQLTIFLKLFALTVCLPVLLEYKTYSTKHPAKLLISPRHLIQICNKQYSTHIFLHLLHISPRLSWYLVLYIMHPLKESFQQSILPTSFLIPGKTQNKIMLIMTTAAKRNPKKHNNHIFYLD